MNNSFRVGNTYSLVEAARKKGVSNKLVLEAIKTVDRRNFLPIEHRSEASLDQPVSIGFGQTTSQPSLMAMILQELELDKSMRVLEIGTGCGYQTALLAELVDRVYSLEWLEDFTKTAKDCLRALKYTNVFIRHGDGNFGWPTQAPYEAIIVSAASEHVPPLLVQQLALGGRMVIPLKTNSGQQWLYLGIKTKTGLDLRRWCKVAFVPLVVSKGISKNTG